MVSGEKQKKKYFFIIWVNHVSSTVSSCRLGVGGKRRVKWVWMGVKAATCRVMAGAPAQVIRD